MTSVPSGRLTIPLRITAPTILIVIGFLWFCYLPNQRLIQNKRVELEKRLANYAKSPKTLDSIKTKLSSVQTELVKTGRECEALSKSLESITTFRSQWLRDSSPGNSPAKSVATALELLRRNNLFCVESGLIASPIQKEDRFVSVHAKSSTPSINPSESRPKTKYRIRLQGRFQDVRMALMQLKEEQPCVVLVSIEMDASDPLSDLRNWTLILHL